MSVSYPLTATARSDAAVSSVEIPQLRIRGIFAVWAAAALPMAVLAWLVAPVLADRFAGEGHVPMAKALIVSLAIGMVWQFVLVATLVGREQRTLRWSTVREALWLRSPRSRRSGRIGGRVWLVVIPLIVAFAAAQELVAIVAAPENRDFATLLESDAGKAFLDGAFGWYGLILVMFLFNTVLGEELLFRGFLLPRMNGAFGRGDWVANGLLFAGYHLHVPWAIPGTLLEMFTTAYPTKRYRSAWIGIAVHSAQSVVLAILILTLVVWLDAGEARGSPLPRAAASTLTQLWPIAYTLRGRRDGASPP
jgi:membrane protease YdiL (CAAX protease family)